MLNNSIYEGGDGGKLYIQNNDIQQSGGLGVMAYFKLFGGNIEASTVSDNPAGEFRNDWWGNDPNASRDTWINSKTERTLKGISLTSAALVEIEEAVQDDLVDLRVYGDIAVDVSYPTINRVRIAITIKQVSEEAEIAIVWDNTKNEIIENSII